MTTKTPAHHKAQYNLVAKKLREQFPTSDNTQLQVVMRGQICELAIAFAKSFRRDNPNFDPIRFLDSCSPDPDRYPISELWEAVRNSERREKIT